MLPLMRTSVGASSNSKRLRSTSSSVREKPFMSSAVMSGPTYSRSTATFALHFLRILQTFCIQVLLKQKSYLIYTLSRPVLQLIFLQHHT